MRSSLISSARAVPLCALLLLASGAVAQTTDAPADPIADEAAPAAPAQANAQKGGKGKGKGGGKAQKAKAAKAQRAGVEWAAFVPEYEAELTRDPASAGALFGRFVAENPDLEPGERINATEDAAQRLFARDAAQLDAALALLEAAKTGAGVAADPTRFLLVSAQAALLRAGGRLAESETLLKATWPAVLAPGTPPPQLQGVLREWMETLSAQHKEAQAEALVWEALAHSPGLLQGSAFAPMMVRFYERQGKREPELSWAKLNFLLVPFEEQSIAEATRRLTKAWVGDDLTVSVARAFATAQSDANAPNPLDDVALPQWPAAVQSALLRATQQGGVNGRVTALVSLGRAREAMVLAREALMRDPTAAPAAARVAWVFKAADGDVARANAFLAYYSSGQGESPLTAFLAEAPLPTVALPIGK